eukprot:5824250-Amphidinium_carterae.1
MGARAGCHYCNLELESKGARISLVTCSSMRLEDCQETSKERRASFPTWFLHCLCRRSSSGSTRRAPTCNVDQLKT